jgi:glycine C-acetyltransferase
MPTTRIEPLLKKKLSLLDREDRRKGRECIICGVIPPRDGKGPRYMLEGHGGRTFLRMNSNSYLGPALDGEVISAEEKAAQRFGTGAGAVRFISGTYLPHILLEKKLAAFHAREAGMLFSSAYAAILSFLICTSSRPFTFIPIPLHLPKPRPRLPQLRWCLAIEDGSFLGI